MNRALLWALLATGAATAWLALQPEAEPTVAATGAVAGAVTAQPAAVARTPQPTPPTPPLAPAFNRQQPWPDVPPLALAAWLPPPPPPAPVRPVSDAPATPPRPPFPYQWLGRLDDGQTVRALLGGAQRSVAVAAGAVLDRRWRVDEVAEAGLTLTWLPSGERLTVGPRPAP